MKFLPAIATNDDYASGPKVGSPTKVAPVAILPDGIQPGTGQKMSAEEMNFLLANLRDAVDAQTLNALQFRPVAGTQTLAFGLDPLTGDMLLDDTDGVNYLAVDGYTDTLGVPVSGGGSSLSGDNWAFSISADVAASGAGCYLIGTVASPNGIEAWRIVDQTLTACAGIVPLTTVASAVTAAEYDAVNGAVVGVHEEAGNGLVFFRIADSATPTINSATTAPASVLMAASMDDRAPILACGGGAAVVSIVDSTDTWRTWNSLDGGATWTEVGSPPVATPGTCLGVSYVPNFKGSSSGAFVTGVPLGGATPSVELYYSTDNGVTWALLDSFEIKSAAFRMFATEAHLYCFSDYDLEPVAVHVYSLATGKVIAQSCPTGVIFNGQRFFSIDSGGGAGAVSGLVQPAINTEGTR